MEKGKSFWKLVNITIVNLEEDGTFVIWWRMSVAKAFLSTRYYPIYKNVIAVMGIIAYEVQQAFSVITKTTVALDTEECRK